MEEIVCEIKKYRVITFLDFELINKSFQGPMGCLNRSKFINLQNKFENDSIKLFVIKDEEEASIKTDEDIRFNDSDFFDYNKIYFLLDDKNETIRKYYTIENIDDKTVNFNQELFYHVISNFGLKTATLEYHKEDIDINKINLELKQSVSAGGISIDLENGFNNEDEETENKDIINIRNFENNGTDHFFKCFENRSYWCQKKFGDLEKIKDIVKDILDKIEDHSYKSYDYDIQLKNFLISRINGSSKILYEIKENKTNRKIFKIFNNIGTNFPIFGFSIENNVEVLNEQNKVKHKIISAEFYSVLELEINTLSKILDFNKNCENLQLLKDEFNKLNTDYIEEINTKKENLQTKLESCSDKEKKIINIKLNKLNNFEEIQKDKCNKINNIAESKIEQKDKDNTLNNLKKKAENQQQTYDKIMEARKHESSYYNKLVIHLGFWESKLGNYTCCGNTDFISSCTRIKPMELDYIKQKQDNKEELNSKDMMYFQESINDNLQLPNTSMKPGRSDN